jgi:hypothetical protein
MQAAPIGYFNSDRRRKRAGAALSRANEKGRPEAAFVDALRGSGVT